MQFMTFIMGYTTVSEFAEISSCTCEGYKKIYECRIPRSGSIIWKGSVFYCPKSSNEIVLPHGNSNKQVCNDGTVVGIIGVVNNTYISQLTTEVNAETIGTNFSCTYEQLGVTKLIGSSVLTLTTGKTMS